MSTRWVVAALFVLAACPARAQQVDSHWSPWLGCWRLVEERVGELAAAGKANPDDTLVCVEPADAPAAVTLTTRISDQPVLRQTIVANGTQRPVDEVGCRGWQSAHWSRTGERLFARAELTCAGEAGRKVSGYSTITGGAWIDIQAIDIEGREHVRVRRYRRAAGSGGQGVAPVLPGDVTAPLTGGTALTIDDIKEAAAQLSPRALEAALMETQARFDLNRRTLIALDDAGVPSSVIDVMVALSYPERFVVERARPQSSAVITGLASAVPGSWYDGFYDTFWGSPYMPYYYAPFGYAYWAGYGVPYYAGTGFVTVDPAASTQSSGGARLVNGAGYTQIRPREAESIDGGIPAGTRGTRSTSGDSSGGGDGGSSAGASSGGYSSGGSSADTGRTAEPR